jgi:predicted RNA-binding protein YlqC (UPF0109 family)
MVDAGDMEGLVRYLVTSLVDEPDKVSVIARHEGTLTVYEVELAPDDVGKIIGRKGRVIKAIRTVVRAAGGAEGAHADVEVLG